MLEANFAGAADILDGRTFTNSYLTGYKSMTYFNNQRLYSSLQHLHKYISRRKTILCNIHASFILLFIDIVVVMIVIIALALEVLIHLPNLCKLSGKKS